MAPNQNLKEVYDILITNNEHNNARIKQRKLKNYTKKLFNTASFNVLSNMNCVDINTLNEVIMNCKEELKHINTYYNYSNAQAHTSKCLTETTLTSNFRNYDHDRNFENDRNSESAFKKSVEYKNAKLKSNVIIKHSEMYNSYTNQERLGGSAAGPSNIANQVVNNPNHCNPMLY